VGRMGSGGKGGGIFGPGSPTSVGANRIRPPHAFETVSPGWEDIPVAHHLRSLRPCCRDSGRLPDVPGPTPISVPFTLHCPFFPASLKNYLAMLQRVMSPGEKYFGGTLGSEGILSLSLHHSAREGRPQGH